MLRRLLDSPCATNSRSSAQIPRIPETAKAISGWNNGCSCPAPVIEGAVEPVPRDPIVKETSTMRTLANSGRLSVLVVAVLLSGGISSVRAQSEPEPQPPDDSAK